MASLIEECKVVHKVVQSRESVFVLTLSLAEVRALRTVLGFVGGDPVTSARRHTDKVYNLLVGHAFALPISGSMAFNSVEGAND